MSIPAHTKYLILAVVTIGATINLTKTTLDILKSSQRIDQVESELTELEETQISLENSIEYKRTMEFVEEKARNDLNMVKPGEQVFIAPDVLSAKTVHDQEEITIKQDRMEKTNLQLWVDLFF